MGSSDFYIADNLFLGRDDRFRLIGWTGPLWASAGAYGSHLLTSYYAIKVYGPGHVIAHNSIAYFHDAIGISTYGTPPRDSDQQASSIDISVTWRTDISPSWNLSISYDHEWADSSIPDTATSSNTYSLGIRYDY